MGAIILSKVFLKFCLVKISYQFCTTQSSIKCRDKTNLSVQDCTEHMDSKLSHIRMQVRYLVKSQKEGQESPDATTTASERLLKISS